MLNYSDHLKAVLYPANFMEVEERVEKRLCQTIQDFSYKCQRNRSDAGVRLQCHAQRDQCMDKGRQGGGEGFD